VKLYADEEGSEAVRGLDIIVVSVLARVEVPSALWRKQRTGAIVPEQVSTLIRGFESDWFGSDTAPPRFQHVDVSAEQLGSAARLVADHGLRAYHAVQLASAEAVRAAEPGCDTFACFDASLRDAAARSGFALYPRE
jgi:predicted nucleic acid-binding protein